MSIAICPGSFDPITLGHLNIIRRSSKIFDKVIVCIMYNSTKTSPMFSVEERVEMARKATSRYPNVSVDSSSGLLAEYAKKYEGAVIVKGLRAASDFEYEFQMALMNRELNDLCETLFMMPSPEYSYVSSRLIKEIAKCGGDISPFVPEIVRQAIRGKFHSKKGA